MMTKYLLTSKSFDGKVLFGYANNMLVYYENDSEMSHDQHSWLMRNFPVTKRGLDEVKPLIKGKLEIVPQDVSFDVFWSAYDKKINRKRCEPLWKKLSPADCIVCLMSIKPYDGYLKRSGGRAKKDPENYLKSQMYLNDWNQLKS